MQGYGDCWKSAADREAKKKQSRRRESAAWKNGVTFALIALGLSQATRADSFLYSDGVFTTLKVPGTAEGINDSGQIVGNNSGSSFLDTNGSITGIFDASANAATLASGINNSGQIVGSLLEISPRSVNDGFLDTAGTFTTINYPTASATGLSDINDFGQIVGLFANISDG